MPFELQATVWTTVILFVLLMLQGTLVPMKQGFGWGLGSRDATRESSPLQGRAARTVMNHVEGMLLFIPLVLVVILADISSALTVLGSLKEILYQVVTEDFDVDVQSLVDDLVAMYRSGLITI